jgi:uncharacterized protein YbjT (DUF2867 family)
MASIKNVAITSASGALGSVIFKKLVDYGQFNIRVLKRAGSDSRFPKGTDVVEVDYESFESLRGALQGQDAVVSCVTSAQTGTQNQLIDAAIAAGVKRFLPSEFGSDLDNPKTQKLPVFAHKVQTQEYIRSQSRGTDMSYTFLYNSGFLDWGLSHHFLLNTAEYKPTIFDGGDVPFSATTLASVGDAVVGVLTHLKETENRAVKIRDVVVTQNQLLSLAKQIAPDAPWEPVDAKLEDIVANAAAKLAEGDYSFNNLVPYLWLSIFNPDYSSDFGKDNQLLGVKGVTEDDIKEILRSVMKG